MYTYVELVPRRPAPAHAATRSATPHFGRSPDAAGACARKLTVSPVLAAAWRAQRLFASSGMKKTHIVV